MAVDAPGAAAKWFRQPQKRGIFGRGGPNEDSTVPAENSLNYFLALRKAGVPSEMHVFEKGPHGVGLANDDPLLAPWSTLLGNWLRLRGFANRS